MIQKNKPGQMFRCEIRTVLVKKEGAVISLVKAPKGVMSTLIDLIGTEVMVTFEEVNCNRTDNCD